MDRSLLAGEGLSEGIGRSAPACAKVDPYALGDLALLTGAGPSRRATTSRRCVSSRCLLHAASAAAEFVPRTFRTGIAV